MQNANIDRFATPTRQKPFILSLPQVSSIFPNLEFRIPEWRVWNTLFLSRTIQYRGRCVAKPWVLHCNMLRFAWQNLCFCSPICCILQRKNATFARQKQRFCDVNICKLLIDNGLIKSPKFSIFWPEHKFLLADGLFRGVKQNQYVGRKGFLLAMWLRIE